MNITVSSHHAPLKPSQAKNSARFSGRSAIDASLMTHGKGTTEQRLNIVQASDQAFKQLNTEITALPEDLVMTHKMAGGYEGITIQYRSEELWLHWGMKENARGPDTRKTAEQFFPSVIESAKHFYQGIDIVKESQKGEGPRLMGQSLP